MTETGPVDTAWLREQILQALERQGFTLVVDARGRPRLLAPHDKTGLQAVHAAAREAQLRRHARFLFRFWPRARQHLADGREVIPESIEPMLEPADDGEAADLFRFFRLVYWSLPYFKGYGRRLRFLVRDAATGKLIGLLGMQSPPIDLGCRDRALGLTRPDKVETVNRSLDVYTLGALPPYNLLLGGKLVAMLAVSAEVREAYRRRYEGAVTWLQGRRLPADLLFLTTTSAYGRSSIYNRLTFRGRPVAEPLGFTARTGTFHLPDELFPHIRAFLAQHGLDPRTGFGYGPRRRLQFAVLAMRRLGLDPELIVHGIPRQVFLFRLAENLEEVLCEGARPRFRDWATTELAEEWRRRWGIPRAQRVIEWRDFRPSRYLSEVERQLTALVLHG